MTEQDHIMARFRAEVPGWEDIPDEAVRRSATYAWFELVDLLMNSEAIRAILAAALVTEDSQ